MEKNGPNKFILAIFNPIQYGGRYAEIPLGFGASKLFAVER